MENQELMQRELEQNEFVNFAIDVYDRAFGLEDLNMRKGDELEPLILPSNPSKLPWKKRMEPTATDMYWYRKNNEIKEFLEKEVKLKSGKIKAVEFKILWKYAQFLRWAEKTIFYKNDQNADIACDSGMFDGTINTDPRKLVIKNNDVVIMLSLSKNKIAPSIGEKLASNTRYLCSSPLVM